ncbi:hypothetical protein PAPHI01_0276 [Pancytospora philotis]|nr:hypothetical protein PAPHI01_0276 [Pancytospora philotis]
MENLQLNGSQFMRRAKLLSAGVKRPLLVMLGKAVDVQEFNINSALFHYLLGYEFPETILLLGPAPTAVVSAKKALLLQQIDGLRVVVKNKDDSNLDAVLGELAGQYGPEPFGVADEKSMHGEFCKRVLARLPHTDVCGEVARVLSVKESNELDLVQKSGHACNYLLQKGIDLLRDHSFSKETLENYMNDPIRGIDSNLIEYAFDPEESPDHLRLGIRYRGYCSEIARGFMTDLTAEYDIQRFVLSVAKPGSGSLSVLSQARSYAASKGYDREVSMCTLGLMAVERDFGDDFTLETDMVFCLNIDNRFCNTFLLKDFPVFVTKKDAKEEYSESRMRFRNKGNDAMLVAQIKEHQKELLDALIEERLEHYKRGKDTKENTVPNAKAIATYEKDMYVPRSPAVALDWDNFYVSVPVLSYSVPFHITCIKNVSLAGDGSQLRFNFKESREMQAELEGRGAQDAPACDSGDAPESGEGSHAYDTFVKSITTKVRNADALLVQVNEMKKAFNKPTLHVTAQAGLKEKFKKYALTDLYMRTDVKATSKKVLGNLELHENGFKYGEIIFLFSAIKNIFFEQGDFEAKALLHFNLKEPIIVLGKPTLNLQFFRKYGFSYHDTSKREDDYIDQIQQEEEEMENNKINSEFGFFADRIEQETSLKVQRPERGFLGVHSKEAAYVSISNECLVSIAEPPFFVLNFDEVEIVNFERVTFVTKTFDVVFVFKNKARPVAAINSIEITRLAYMKELFDSHNIVFMETKINLNWPNLLGAIMNDPVSFYSSGAWVELLQEDAEEESDVSSEEEDSDSSLSSVGTTTSSDDMSDISVSEEEGSDEASLASSDEEEEEESSEEEDKRKKRRR